MRNRSNEEQKLHYGAVGESSSKQQIYDKYIASASITFIVKNN